jgi:hypothetical protein
MPLIHSAKQIDDNLARKPPNHHKHTFPAVLNTAPLASRLQDMEIDDGWRVLTAVE